MKTRIVKPLVWGLLSLVLVVAAYLKGRTDVWTAEFKVYHGNLTSFVDAEHAPELKAFLKARYYYLANKIPKSWLEGAAKDYGTVTTNELNRIVVKGSEMTIECLQINLPPVRQHGVWQRFEPANVGVVIE